MRRFPALPALALMAIAAALVACGGPDASSSPVGTYVLVKDQALMDGLRTVAGGDAPQLSAAEIDARLKGLEASLVLEGDKTFAIRGNMGQPFEASGKWTLNGSELTLTMTHTNGEPRKEPEVTKLNYDGHEIRMPKDPKSVPFDMVLRRK